MSPGRVFRAPRSCDFLLTGLYARVTISPSDWYALKMELRHRPLPGFPENYAIACRRSRRSGIPDPSQTAYGAPQRFGEWDQPISRELFRRIMAILGEARIPPMTSGAMVPCLDGPATTGYLLELDGARFEWISYDHRPGWKPLQEAIWLMERAVCEAAPVELPPNYFRSDT